MLVQRYHTLTDYFHQTGASRQEVAQRIGISKQHLSLIESGRRYASPGLTLRLVDYTGVNVYSVVSPDLALLLHRVSS